MSMPLKSAVAVSSTTTSPSPHGSVEPAERAEAKNRTEDSGKDRSASRVRMTLPTWPVAPNTPMVGFEGRVMPPRLPAARGAPPSAFGRGRGSRRRGAAAVCDHGDVFPTDRADEVAATPFGIYVHVPFCERRCGYCAFTTVAVGDPEGEETAARIERYVAAAIDEVRTAAAVLGGGAPPVTSVFFGGGTPTMLSAEQVGRVLGAVIDVFDVRDDLEVTVESNPDGLRPGQLAALHAVGATRMSFGMQSIRRRVLALLDRTHDPERALAAAAEARSVGFEHVSLDLIYGTPGETEEDWAATLGAVIGTDVDHVSAYALGIEAGTKLAARVRSGELATPDDDVAANRYQLADHVLGRAGFSWYELSNWARDDDARCRHNLLYWRNQNWWGVGPGAHSHLSGLRWWNVGDTDRWAAGATDAELGSSRIGGHELLNAEQRELERVLTGIRLAEGLPLIDEVALDDHVRDLVEVRDGRAVLTDPGRLLADEVVRCLTV